MRVEDARAWLDAYAAAWEGRDPDAAAALFAQRCTYRSMIFDEPHRDRAGVRAYWRRATGSQSDVRVLTGPPVVSGQTVVAEWWTTMTDAGEGEITLPGVLVLQFDGDGSCRALREYWAFGSGRTQPPGHWGRVEAGGQDRGGRSARSWADAYATAWQVLDVAAIPPLFSADALYASHPLREPDRGRDAVRAYTERAFQDQAGGPVDARLAVVASAGAAAAVEYWARITSDGEPVTLAGCDVLAFDGEGLCALLRDYWHVVPGHREPPPEWGT